jgi:arylsulfatase A-like enzyme
VPEGKDGERYYFPDDLTDKAVEWLHGVRAQDADKPWFMYYSTGCAHAPHHVAKEWADRYKGKFDQGWDTLREEVFERQKRFGVIPQDAVLTARPDLLPAWDSLDDTAKRLYIRQMEVYAGFQENADWNVGRLLDAVEQMGELKNTLVFYIWGDNGASLEGTTTGSFNELTFLNGVVLDPEQQLKLIDQYGGIDALGGDHTAPHVAAAWAWAGNTPFQWGKQIASHLGGTCNPMVVAWPGHIKPGGELRSQFTHCIDIGPTILEAAGIPEPKMVDGIAQEPMDGTSFLYSFDDPEAAERHTVQYFEVIGARAIYKDGWWACSKLDKAPWDLSPETIAKWGPGSGWDPDKDVWELYYLPDDFTQAHDLATEQPDKLSELKALFWQEAERNRALPLLGSICVFYGILPPLPTVTRYAFAGDVQNVQKGLVPRVAGRSYAIEAELHVPDGGAEGVIVANADFIGGWALWLDKQGRLNHTYSFLGIETYRQVSTEKVPVGQVNVKMLFEIDENKPGSGGKVTLWAADKQIGEGRLEKTIPMLPTSYAGMDIGRDNGLVVDLDYEDIARTRSPALSSGSSSTSNRRSTTRSRHFTSTRASTRWRTASPPRYEHLRRAPLVPSSAEIGAAGRSVGGSNCPQAARHSVRMLGRVGRCDAPARWPGMRTRAEARSNDVIPTGLGPPRRSRVWEIARSEPDRGPPQNALRRLRTVAASRLASVLASDR